MNLGLTLDLRAFEGDRTAAWDVVLLDGIGNERLLKTLGDVEEAEDWAVAKATRYVARGYEVWLTETDEGGTKDLRTYLPDGTVTDAVET